MKTKTKVISKEIGGKGTDVDYGLESGFTLLLLTLWLNLFTFHHLKTGIELDDL